MLRLAGALAALVMLGCAAQARIVEIRIEAVEPFPDNAAFGEWCSVCCCPPMRRAM